VIGILVAIYGGLGVAQAVQYAMNTVWWIPRNNRPSPIKARGGSLARPGAAPTGRLDPCRWARRPEEPATTSLRPDGKLD
jgi:hypothetical protein